MALGEAVRSRRQERHWRHDAATPGGKPGKRRRHISNFFASLFGAVAFAALLGCGAQQRSWIFSSSDKPSGPLRRREAGSLLVSAMWLGGQSLALAEGPLDALDVIAEGRKKAVYEAREGGFLGANRFRKPTGYYNFTDLQSFLPNVYLVKRTFESQLKQLNNPKNDMGDPQSYDLMRQENRREPVKKIRKDFFRAKLWIQQYSGVEGPAETAYERIKRALDEEDTQCLVLSRAEYRVPSTGLKTTRRNVQALIDSIDDMLELIPKEERDAAELIAETRPVSTISFPLRKKTKKKGNATEASVTSTATGTNSTGAAPAGKLTTAEFKAAASGSNFPSESLSD
eukprot:TRINITY_DN90160_c0_g1_i1.p1 TRINITY_DN90160_c0_g1~~TRINITY_DN90160_c0_g1_i1.p1  ORF type:complete len:342 (+),score=47.41 TRINITY_DN90160_c0_g1_i1:56-1081(+)